MDPNGFSSVLANFKAKYQKLHIFAKNRRKNRPSTCKTAIMDPLGSIIVVLQVRGTSLAQNPIKGAKRKNRPPPVTALGIYTGYVDSTKHFFQWQFYALLLENELGSRNMRDVTLCFHVFALADDLIE